MSDDLVERVARAIAKSQGDDFDQMPLGKSEWTASRGHFGGRFRDINEPMKSDYLDMARAAITAIDAAGYVVVPREPTNRMLKASCSAMSDGKRPTPDRVSSKEKHRIRYRAMIDAALEKDKANVG